MCVCFPRSRLPSLGLRLPRGRLAGTPRTLLTQYPILAALSGSFVPAAVARKVRRSAAFSNYSRPTPGSIDEKQTASELLCPLCLSTLRPATTLRPGNDTCCSISQTPLLQLGHALSHCSSNVPACIPNRQSTSPQNLSLATLCRKLGRSTIVSHILTLSNGYAHFRLVPLSSPHSWARPGRVPLLSFLASVLNTIITYAQPKNNIITIEGQYSLRSGSYLRLTNTIVSH